MSTSRRNYPYYKIQVFDSRSLTWIERRRGFDSVEQARSHIQEQLSGETTRVVRVDETGYQPIGEAE